MNIVLYQRADCPKCELAAQVLRRNNVVPQRIDIDDDAELSAQYACCVPVVLINGKVRFRGQVNEVLLRRILHPHI